MFSDEAVILFLAPLMTLFFGRLKYHFSNLQRTFFSEAHKCDALSLSLLQNYGVVGPQEAPAALKQNGSPVSTVGEETHQCDSVWPTPPVSSRSRALCVSFPSEYQ